MLIKDALVEITERFRLAGIASAAADAEILLAHFLGVSRGEIQALSITAGEIDPELFSQAVERRVRREPLQHITGLAPFRSLLLEVGPGVFIPRFETEMVAGVGIDYLRSLPVAGKAVDVCTGSGAIAIALAKETSAQISAIELSESALEYAARNIAAHEASVELIAGNFEAELLRFRDLDLVISNPPYIPAAAVPIDPEVAQYDPGIALYSGPDGLDAIRELIAISEVVLRSGGMLVLEHADGQSDDVRELLLTSGWRGISVHPDAVGRLRAISALRK